MWIALLAFGAFQGLGWAQVPPPLEASSETPQQSAPAEGLSPQVGAVAADDPLAAVPLDLGSLGAEGSGGFTIRDPFKAPVLKASEEDGPRTPLELVPADKFKLTGVITGPDRFRAMLLDPAGQTHLVSERMKIGVRKGVIKKITSRGIWIQEKVVNVLGQEENVDTVLKLENPSKSVAASGGGE